MNNSTTFASVFGRFLTAVLFVVALNSFVPTPKGEVGLFSTKLIEMPSFFK
jgi:hypothetical protein